MPDNVDLALAAGWPLSADTVAANRQGRTLEDDIQLANQRMAEAAGKGGRKGKPRKSTLANPAGEDLMQVKLIEWSRQSDTLARYPELAYLWHTPNGGGRSRVEGAMMKRLGTIRGVLDLTLPVPRGGYHSYFAELKVRPNDLTPEQKQMVAFLRAQGHYVAVYYDDWQLAAVDIEAYLEGARIRPGGERGGLFWAHGHYSLPGTIVKDSE